MANIHHSALLRPETLLGLTPTDPRLEEIFGKLILQGHEHEDWYAELPNFGVELMFSSGKIESVVLEKIFFYLSQTSADERTESVPFDRFDAAKIYGVAHDSTTSDVIEKMGKPDFTREELETKIMGFFPSVLGYVMENGKAAKFGFKNDKLYDLIVITMSEGFAERLKNLDRA